MRKISIGLVSLMVATNALAAAWTGSNSLPETTKKIDSKIFHVITNADELAWIANEVNTGNTTVNAILANDITFGSDKSTLATIPWVPIGADSAHTYEGTLDGNGHTIYGLFTNVERTHSGLIGISGSKAVVKNLNMSAGKLQSTSSFRYKYLGGIASINHGTIQNCHVENTYVIPTIFADGQLAAGTIAGVNRGTISNVVSNGTFTTSASTSSSTTARSVLAIGGISGQNFGKINFAKNLGNIQGFTIETNYIGGISGQNSGSITEGVNGGNISGKGSYITFYMGGIVGQSTGSVNKCYNTGSVTNGTASHAYTGGIIGMVNSTTLKVTDSYNLGIVGTNAGSSAYSGGGLIGYGYSTTKGSLVIKNCFSAAPSLTGNENIGGVMGSFGNAGMSSVHFDVSLVPGTALTKYTSGDLGSNVSAMTTENMQKDQFAWFLNTAHGTEANSNVWTRGETGYPVIAHGDSLPIHKITFNDDGAVSNRYTNYKGLVAFPSEPEPASGFIFAGWFNESNVMVKPGNVFTADETLNAKYINLNDIFYEINFYANDTLVYSYKARHGSIITYAGEVPQKASTAEYNYEFDGWDKDISSATENTNYYATFKPETRNYQVNFVDFNNESLSEQSLPYGATPSFNDIPERVATREWTYTYKGWDPEIASVENDVTYKAVYDSTKVQYSVTFMVGKDVVEVQKVPYGESAVAPDVTVPEGQKFISWTPSYENVKEDIVVEALFEEIAASSSSTGSSSSETSSLQGMHSAKASFGLHVNGRSLQLSNVRVGDTFAVMDMQGRVMNRGTVSADVFNVMVPRSGNYIVRAGSQTKFVTVK